jgi:hypothetical protein
LKPKRLIRYPPTVRTNFTRWLAILTALALVCGGVVRAELLFAPAGCHQDLAGDTSSHHGGQHHHDSSLPGCIDCLACVGFVNTVGDPSLSIGPVFLSTIVSYHEGSVAPTGRILSPDTDPPKRSA